MTSRVVRGLLAVLALVALGSVPRATAVVSTTAPADRSVAQLIEDVQSADYTTREAATQALMRLSPYHRGEIEAALARTSNEEAITRLEKAAVHLYMKPQISLSGEVGFLGVHMTDELLQLDPKSGAVQSCIVVWKTQPGFPSAEVLEPGDRIIGINGERFSPDMSPDLFKEMIQKSRGGSVLQLSLIRNGRLMDVKVQLAGLRSEDTNPAAIADIVGARDRAAAEYRASLKTGRSGPLATDRDEPPRNYYDGSGH
ncbi:MAG TPA: PDZ domain-containing protein [Phycisphaerae bacterium]|nr:PDZ domain-containing protein [Phycisphaerae bacterium]